MEKKKYKWVSTEYLRWTNAMFLLTKASKIMLLPFCCLEVVAHHPVANLEQKNLETSQAREWDNSSRIYMLVIMNLRQWEQRWKHCWVQDFWELQIRVPKQRGNTGGSNARSSLPYTTPNLGKWKTATKAIDCLSGVLDVLFCYFSLLLCKTG